MRDCLLSGRAVTTGLGQDAAQFAGARMSEMTIEELASRLLREGSVDNEADARMAAVRIIVATEHLTSDSRRPDADEV